ncbi:MAG: alpha/beta hydrolase [Oscillospiraceae bacterium]|nr:alpha/beta hydrolase [Oscillospiraceae bacterium]
MKKRVPIGALALCSAFVLEETYRHAFGRTEPWVFQKLRRHRQGSHGEDFYRTQASDETVAWKAPHEVFSIRNRRGQPLKGYLWPAGEKRSSTVAFIIHGFRSDGCQAAGPFLSYYKSRGVDVFACDHAGAGESGGQFYGYDYTESLDCRQWLHMLTNLYGRQVRILLHGFSMGAATVMRLSDQCPPQVRFLVSDCGFSSARDILTYQTNGCRAAYPLLRAVNFLANGFDLKRTDVRPHLRKSILPFLFVHGTADPTVPYAMAEELFGLCASSDKQLLAVEGGLHVESYRRAKAAYEEKLDTYLNKYCPR